jgi:hypothetical protein
VFNGTTLTIAGTYKDSTLQNHVGCDSVITLVLSVNPFPHTPTITVANCNLVCDSTASTYQWNLAGNAISGATSQFYTATQSGFYTVTITDANGCSKTSAVANVTCATGIQDVALTTIKVYPNPTSNDVQIDFGALVNKGTIKVYNTVGAIVQEIKIENQNISTLHLANYANGVYWLSVQINNQTQRIKIVKQD